jgi:hypothetical protein
MKIHGNFQEMEMCGISTSGAIQILEKHRKHGVRENRVSIGAFLRDWKHWMKCHNENQFGNFFF